MSFTLVDNNGSGTARIILGEDEFKGVMKAASWLSQDIERVTEKTPEILAVSEISEGITGSIIAGTIGKSGIIEKAAGIYGADISGIKGKREVYGIFPAGGNVIIAGSDKRGTIYGLLHISEKIGVTPMIYFGDTVPVKYSGIYFDDVEKTEGDSLFVKPYGISKEPSVKYRGFFINDEWPAFGNWCNRNFGGFTASCYEKVFEYLLRLKGNYMWPAMWSSIFSEDGPGLASAELADELGVVMGTSHHEPCCRAGEEFCKLNKTHPEYGTAWNFITNREGVTKFWEDGLKRNGHLENVITVGMRGERDSKLFEDAKLIDNINVLKSAINTQKELIAKYAAPDQPLMLAIYKEVEEYYKGDAVTPGLKDWDGLDGITLMLCDDNFGNLRLMMDDDKRDHKGGYGMYYHFDYHGDPVSYEWVNSSYLPKIWEQMTTAYDFGIRDIWIVNVGDLKNQELPLNYFMDLAYDFEKYGTNAPGNYVQYLRDWVDDQFKGLEKEDRDLILEIADGYTRLNNITKPEVLSDETYSLRNYSEAHCVLKAVKDLEKKTEALIEELDEAHRDSFMSLIGYQALASFNLIKMQIYAGINKRNAMEGRVTANKYAGFVKDCIAKDRKLTEDFHSMLSGKWYGMGMSKHIGFRAWNDEGCRMPLMVYIEPEAHNDLVVADDNSNFYSCGGDWTRRPVRLTGFDYMGRGSFSIASAGSEPVTYKIECDDSNIIFSGKDNRYILSGIADAAHDISIKVDAAENARYGRHEFTIKTSAGFVKVYFEIKDNTLIKPAFENGINKFNGKITQVPAANYSELKDSSEGSIKEIVNFGRLLPGEKASALKAYPQERSFKEGPVAEYKIETPVAGKFRLIMYTAPSNPSSFDNRISCMLKVNDGEEVKIDTIPEGYIGGDNRCNPWRQNVLENVRKTETVIELSKGVNTVSFRPLNAGFVLEKLVIARSDVSLPECRLGVLS